jgi:hypothetical protein
MTVVANLPKALDPPGPAPEASDKDPADPSAIPAPSPHAVVLAPVTPTAGVVPLPDAAKPRIEGVTQQAFASIREEAEQRRNEREEQHELREDFPRIEQAAREQQRQELERERSTFRSEVQALLRREVNEAGPAIWSLVLRSSVRDHAVADVLLARDRKSRAVRLNRNARIVLLRTNGLSEAEILRELVEEQRKLMPSRKGPRTLNEAIVRAARQLIAAPLTRPDDAVPATAVNSVMRHD